MSFMTGLQPYSWTCPACMMCPIRISCLGVEVPRQNFWRKPSDELINGLQEFHKRQQSEGCWRVPLWWRLDAGLWKKTVGRKKLRKNKVTAANNTSIAKFLEMSSSFRTQQSVTVDKDTPNRKIRCAKQTVGCEKTFKTMPSPSDLFNLKLCHFVRT